MDSIKVTTSQGTVAHRNLNGSSYVEKTSLVSWLRKCALENKNERGASLAFEMAADTVENIGTVKTDDYMLGYEDGKGDAQKT